MARTALSMKIAELATLADVSTNTVVRFERGEDLKQGTIRQLREALERAGVEFIPENGGGPGVRLKRNPE